MTAVLAESLDLNGVRASAIAVHERAAGIARLLGDRVAESDALFNLGETYLRTDDYVTGMDLLDRARIGYRTASEALGEANALCYLGLGRYLSADYPAAITILEQAIEMYRELGDRRRRDGALPRIRDVILASTRAAAITGPNPPARVPELIFAPAEVERVLYSG
ncbi:tetratricopeptide repeat protein [Nocardia aurantiaca]|uniref:Tetratricopeptide repeat protein n=1 Tax=Nocardia aurantiaca TaxID=2675850 RepID=A0A6I3KYZ4_9NOCA|nr:tetratricopeptide repeat protein [Nocardia aurantiaca]MTE13464.1 hypothetical protein [Nocardia aurantiaca]